MENQATHTSASELQRQEREDRLGCRCGAAQREHPRQAVPETLAARPASGIVADAPTIPAIALADQFVLDDLHERLGS